MVRMRPLCPRPAASGLWSNCDRSIRSTTMPAISRILLPVDFSQRSAGAARYAAALARHFHSELILLHALEILPWIAQAGWAYEGAMPPETLNAVQEQRTQ